MTRRGRGRYASCGHAGRLSCLLEYFFDVRLLSMRIAQNPFVTDVISFAHSERELDFRDLIPSPF